MSAEDQHPRAVGARTLLRGLAVAACATIMALILLLVGRPLSTPDLWFHLKAGETYWHQGLWPARDPMLFTGLPTGPVQHEWLFGVFAYLTEAVVGLQGLRLAHITMAFALVALVAKLCRNASGSWPGACVGISAFLVLAWPRLMQFRPDLWTMGAVCLLYMWVLAAARGPSRHALVAAAAVQLLWSNAHSLAAIGLALTAAALLGALFEHGILGQRESAAPSVREATVARIRRLAIALPLLAAVSVLHPRGADQLLTFFSSTSDTAIWEIRDEWSPFDPLVLANNPRPVSLLSWLVADAVLLSFALLVGVRVRALRVSPSAETLRRLDPPAFLTAAAACGAMLISVRFLWMGLLPLLYLLSSWKRLSLLRPRVAELVAAGGTCLFAASIWGAGGLGAYAGDLPRDTASYLSQPVNRGRFAHRAARFLADTGVEGRLFNPYELGAYYGYMLAPRVRTFIDSRTEHYSAAVFEQWKAVTFRQRDREGRSFLQLLDDREVDFFLGVGAPGYGYALPYTLAHLDAQPGWLRVYRNAGQVVYLRDVPRNQTNLARIEQYYQRHGVPFDRTQGLAVGAAIEQSRRWAMAQDLVDEHFYSLVEQAEDAEKQRRARALVAIADRRFVTGDYAGAVRDARRALSLGVRGARPAEIVVAALQRRGDGQGARQFLHELDRGHGGEAWAQRFLARFRR